MEEGRPAYHPALLLKRRSETDPDSRFLRDRKGFTLGYTAEVAVSEDHLIVEQRVGQNATDSHVRTSSRRRPMSRQKAQC